MITADGLHEYYSDETSGDSNDTINGNDTESSSETDAYSQSDGYSESDGYSQSVSTPTDHSLSPSPPSIKGTVGILSIDKAILKPIKDSIMSEEEEIKKEEKEEKTEKGKLKRRKLNWKLKRTKSVKIWQGFTKILSLFACDSIIKEKDMKEICHREFCQLLNKNTKKSRHCSIIRNFEIFNEQRICDITKNIFTNSNYSVLTIKQNNDENECVDIWNLGLIMLFMVNGKQNIIQILKNKDNFQNLIHVQDFLWDIYMKRKISTNLFDLLYFYILICEQDHLERQSRYQQITNHLWFDDIE